MTVIILIMLQVIVSCLGNDGYITVLNIKPSSNSDNKYECYTPSIFTEYALSYGRSFVIHGTDDLTETQWTVSQDVHKYVTSDDWNMGVYFCKIVIDDVTTIVQTTKIKSNAKITPSNSKSSITVNAGDDVTITFNANEGITTVTWRKDFDKIAIDNTAFSIEFNPVNIDNAGMYEMHGHGKRKNRDHSFIKLIVRACSRHKWGPDCTGDCEYCYNGGVCDDKTGLCICAPGFMGSTCETECGGNKFGWNCENSCTNDSSLDACTDKQFCLPDPYGCSCVTGFKGLDCTTACSSGEFGADCAQSCHCKQGECDQYTGICIDNDDSSCAPPWTGSNCQKCEPAFFGENCDIPCTKQCICHRLTGECVPCNSNWLEPYCDIGIINTTFTPANDGHVTDVYCTISHAGTQEVHTIVMVTKNDVTKNITSALQTEDSSEITSYKFSVTSDIDSTYTCVILHAGESAQSAIVPNIFLLPSYNGSLEIDITSSSAITIEWTAWDNTTDNGDGPVVGYILYHRFSNVENDVWEQSVVQNTLSGTASGLMWDTNYTFAVSAVRPGEGGEGPIGIQRISAKTLCGKPSPVENVNHEVSDTNPQSIKVTWTEIEVDAETLKCFNITYIYTVYLKLNDDEGIGYVVYQGSGIEVMVDNIDIEATYVIYVTVSNKDSESDFVESSLSLPDNDAYEEGSVSSAIIGGSVGAVVCCVVIVVIVIRWKRRSGEDEKGQTGEEEIQLDSEEKIGLPPTGNSGDDSVYLMDKPLSSSDVGISSSSPSLRSPESEMLTYENVEMKSTEITYSRRIPISELVLYVTKTLQTGLLHNEFGLLPVGQTRPWENAAKECHKTKNRFKNIIPYDHARVVLDRVAGNPESDYYNASYINGYNGQRHYIACQGPNKDSLNDYWRMIWQLKIEVIVMLTNIYEGPKEKCKKYWPNEQELLVFNDISVTVDSEETYDDYTIRTIDIWLKDERRIIKQFQFISWPDMGVPMSATGLLSLVKKIRNTRATSSIPAVIHCSAGVGRTGTYIVIDAMLDMIEAEENVDVLKYLKDIRDDRVNMVQTVDQYVFIYNALVEFHLNSVVQFPLSEFTSRVAHLKRLNPATKKTFIEEEFELLIAVTPSQDPEAMSSGREEHSIKKNRFANVLPVDRSRVILKSESNSYINASFLNGYRMCSRFVATQMPLTETVDDLWRLVNDWKATTLVMLNSMDKSDPTCAQYWQEDEGSTKHVENLKIQFNSKESRGEHIIIRKFSITNASNKKSEPLTVTQYQVTDWPVGQDSPDRLETLLEVYEIVESNLDEKRGHPIVVHCMNGIGRTGVYCAITEILDRMKHDDVIDIFQSVKRLRANRPGLVENVEQYTLCYELVGAYLQRFATYSN